MRRWIRRGAAVAGAGIGGAVVASALAGLAWSRATAREVERLAVPEPFPGGDVYSPEELAGLPAPVVRYFELALTPGQPRVRSARVEHEGEFRTALGAPAAPFRSVEHFSVDPPGFVWDAEMRMAPLVAVRVRDRYSRGRAAMLGKVAGLVPVVDQEGSPGLAAGALLRYLAEAAWLPTALLPAEGVAWEAVDDSTARASLTDAGVTVSMDVHFGGRGEIVRVEAERHRDVGGVGVPTPWVGRFGRYERVAGMMVPMDGSVEWVLPEGRLVYWRGRVVRASYELAR